MLILAEIGAVVDHDVNVAAARQRVAAHPLDLLFDGQVALELHRLDAQSFDLPGRFFQTAGWSPVPGLSVRALSTMSAPARANATAILLPIPLLDPVTNATCPLGSFGSSSMPMFAAGTNVIRQWWRRR